jgi:hypothetical protein
VPRHGVRADNNSSLTPNDAFATGWLANPSPDQGQSEVERDRHEQEIAEWTFEPENPNNRGSGDRNERACLSR